MMQITRQILAQRIEDNVGASTKVDPVTITIDLTDEEMRHVYEEYRTKVHFRDWVMDLLEENGYKRQDEKTLIDMAETYIDLMEGMGFGDRLGELEHDVFEYMMENIYPEIETKEEEN